MFQSLFSKKKPIIGMIHLPPLPGYPKSPGMHEIIKKALIDLETLEKAGFSGALVENDNDQPHQIGVSPNIISAFQVIMERLLSIAHFPVGMEIIYDMKHSIMVASKVNAPFVRLDVFVDDVETKWGKIFGMASELMRLKNNLEAKKLMVLTDIHVKHAKLLHKKTLEESSREAIEYGSDGLIVTGDLTGTPPLIEDCIRMKKVSKYTPIIIGSGLTVNNAHRLLKYCDGAIVGSSIKTGEYVDFKKAFQLMRKVQNIENHSL